MTKAFSVHSLGIVRRIVELVIAAGALCLSGALFLSDIGHADDMAVLAGNHPVEIEKFSEVGNVSPDQNLEVEIRFALRHQKALAKLLADQQNQASPNYHKWLTTEEFLKRFGPAKSEVTAVTRWLGNEGFVVKKTSGTTLEVSGSVAQAQRAFAVRIARFGNGSAFANTTDPLIPRRFADVIGAVTGLDNMMHTVAMNHRYPMPVDDLVGNKVMSPAELPMQLAVAESASDQEGTIIPEVVINGITSFGPTDLRTFYDETVGTGSDGTGSCIAVVGTSDFLDSTMTGFATQFALPAISYTRVLHGTNPGRNGAEAEAELDLQWSHVTAPGASIMFHLGSNLVTDISGAVNDNLCGAISISYGFCGVSASFMQNSIDPLMQQAATQGQSVFVSSGDDGAAGITLNSAGTACVASNTLQVSELAADPNLTGVSGTQFSPAYSGGKDQGYATEKVWNDGSGATGGGVSQVFSKPAYQTGAGVPNDGKRDVPDISLIASPNSPGVFWDNDVGGTATVRCCIGGTSLSAPLWAGFATVIGQKVGKRLGNLNQIIYPLANSQYAAAGFHDVSSGNNNFNGVTGYGAGSGYDLSTGWGTVDFNVFAGAVKTFLEGTSSATPTPTRTATPTGTATPTVSRTATPTRTATATRTATVTRTATATATVVAPTATITRTATRTATPTATSTATSGITLVGSTSSTTTKLTVPAGVQNGDLLLASYSYWSFATATAPSGWTLLHTATASGSGVESVWYRFASNDTPGAGYTWTFTGATPYEAGGMLAYRRVDPIRSKTAFAPTRGAAPRRASAPSTPAIVPTPMWASSRPKIPASRCRRI